MRLNKKSKQNIKSHIQVKCRRGKADNFIENLRTVIHNCMSMWYNVLHIVLIPSVPKYNISENIKKQLFYVGCMCATTLGIRCLTLLRPKYVLTYELNSCMQYIKVRQKPKSFPDFKAHMLKEVLNKNSFLKLALFEHVGVFDGNLQRLYIFTSIS